MDAIVTLTMVITTIIVHELSHSLTYVIINNFKNERYIVIDKISIYISAKKINGNGGKIIALSGPVIGGILSLAFYALSMNIIYIVLAFYHFAMLLPFFEDGKNLWNQIRE